jgi:hypothetical protein
MAHEASTQLSGHRRDLVAVSAHVAIRAESTSSRAREACSKERKKARDRVNPLDDFDATRERVNETRVPGYRVPSMVAPTARFRGGFEQKLI